MYRRLLWFSAVAAALLLSAGADCGRRHWPPPSIRLSSHVTFVGHEVTACVTAESAPAGGYHIAMDWGDTTEWMTEEHLPTDTVVVSHRWDSTGTYLVRVFGESFESGYWPEAGWSEPETVTVFAGGPSAPVIDTVFFDPPFAVKNEEAFVVVKAHDPDGDSLRLMLDWGDGKDTTTEYFASPCSITVGHVFTKSETAMVIIRAQDVWGATSFPDTVSVPVGVQGGVIWYWWDNDEDQGGLTTSPLALRDGDGEECIYAGCEDDFMFYAIRTSNGRDKKSAATKWPEWSFTGHPAFCEATQHIIVGSDEGELYALELDGLGRAWMWPDKPAEESLTYIEWGAAAIRDNRLYVPHDDDSLFYFIDSVDHGVRVATFTPHAAIIDAPAIDAQGNVYFGTDSGYLYKVGPELDTIFWRSHLLANGEIHGPTIGGDGTIYCASDPDRIHAIDPANGVPYWSVSLGEYAFPFRLALGQTALFVGTSVGKAYSINPATGSINWEKSLSRYDGFSTTPIVTANGYVYFQNDADVLFCVNQADGTIIWSCDCPRYLPRTGGNSHRPRKTGPNDFPPNPTILPNGNIIVCGDDALYCVAGYAEGPLDPLAPWPKWQHDVYNTGYVHGGP